MANQFNETVDGVQETQNQGGKPGNPVQPGDMNNVAATPNQQQQQEVPAEEPVQEQQRASAGVIAAQDFVAPLIDAAMQGDENAKDIIARTAASMAVEADRAASNQAPVEEEIPVENNQQQQPQQQQQQPGAAEQAANQIIPEGQEKTSSIIVGAEDIMSAINLFR